MLASAVSLCRLVLLLFWPILVFAGFSRTVLTYQKVDDQQRVEFWPLGASGINEATTPSDVFSFDIKLDWVGPVDNRPSTD